jgi:hypothetical protein
MATQVAPSYYDQVTDMGMKHHNKLKEWMASKPDLAAALFMAMAIVIIVQIIFYVGKALIDKLMVHVAPSWWAKFLAKKAAAADAASTAFAKIVAAGKKTVSGFEVDGVRDPLGYGQDNILARFGGTGRTAFQSDYGGQAAFYTAEDHARPRVQTLAHHQGGAHRLPTRPDGCLQGMMYDERFDACVPAQDCAEPRDIASEEQRAGMDEDPEQAWLRNGGSV